MKVKVTLPVLLLSTMLMAQVGNLPTVLNLDQNNRESPYGVVPKSLSFDGSNRVYVRTADNQVSIYSNAFTPVKSFAITPTLNDEQRVNFERTVTVTVTGGELISSKVTLETWHDKNLLELYLNCTDDGCETTYTVPENWTENDVKNYLDTSTNVVGNVGTIISTQSYPEGGTMFIWDMEAFYADGSETLNYWEANKYGKQYPRVFYLWKDGYLYYCSNVYYLEDNNYSERNVSFSYSDWTEVGRIPHEWAQDHGISFINYDNDQIIFDDTSGDGLCITQTLFNDDEKYEYLSFPTTRYTEVGELPYPEEPVCYDCYSESTTYTQSTNTWIFPIYTGFNVMSEDGSTLQSVSFPNGFQMTDYVAAQIVQLENEYYIICTGDMGANTAMLVYKINRTGSGASVQQVSEPQQVSGSYKYLRHSNVYIKQGNKTYTITGTEVK